MEALQRERDLKITLVYKLEGQLAKNKEELNTALKLRHTLESARKQPEASHRKAVMDLNEKNKQLEQQITILKVHCGTYCFIKNI